MVESIYPLLPTYLPNLTAFDNVSYPPFSVSALSYSSLCSLHQLQSLKFVTIQNNGDFDRFNTSLIEGIISLLPHMSPTLTELAVPSQISHTIMESVNPIRQLAPLRELKAFELRYAPRLSSELLQAFCETFPNITKFPSFAYDENMTLNDLSPILSLHELNEITFDDCDFITDEFIDSLITSCPDLSALGVTGCPLLTISIVSSLSRAHSLDFLLIHDCAGIPELDDWVGRARSVPEQIRRACTLSPFLTPHLVRKYTPFLSEWDRRMTYKWGDDYALGVVQVDRYAFFSSLVQGDHLDRPITIQTLHIAHNGKEEVLKNETMTYEEVGQITRTITA